MTGARETTSGVTPAIRLRHPVEDDHPLLVAVVDEWWGGRRVRASLPRLWLQHFTGTSVVAQRDAGGTPVGFVIGFVSPDHPHLAYLHLIGVAPGHRRKGVGRTLVERWAEVVRARGASRATTIAWPGDPAGLAFLRAVGFAVDAGPGTRALYGTAAHTDWNREGDDQAVLHREL